MSDRIFSLLLLIIGLLYGAAAQTYNLPFSYDPLGPKPVPLFLSGSLVVLSLVLLLRAQKLDLPRAPTWTRALWLATILVFYQLTWTLLGFLLATTISLYLASRLFHCSWMQGLMTALILSVVCYGLFNFIIGISLPLGTVFTSGVG